MKPRTQSPLRDMRIFQSTTCAGRSLLQSVLMPEVGAALAAWIKASGPNKGVLIGGLAVSFYIKPFVTTDVDLLFLSEEDIPKDVPGFTHDRGRAFQDSTYQVTIDTFTPASFGGTIPDAIARQVVSTAIENSGMRIASREGLIAMKLCRRSLRDQADVVDILNAYPDTHLDGWPITAEQRRHLAILQRHARGEDLAT